MTNVQSPANTLVSALPSGAAGMYPTEFAAVVEALTERDYALTDQITDVVNREFGTDKETIRHQLSLAGMAVRPAPEPVVPDMAAFEEAMTAEAPAKKAKKGKKSEVAKLAKVVNKLVKAARRNGISI